MLCSFINLFFISLAGIPPTTVYGLTFLVTTEPAATIEPLPIVTPGSKIVPAASQTSSSTITFLSICPCLLIEISF